MRLKLDTKKIYLAMAERGITVTEIARQGGVSQQAVSNALNGNRVGKVIRFISKRHCNHRRLRKGENRQWQREYSEIMQR